jgi:hypothetical protein
MLDIVSFVIDELELVSTGKEDFQSIIVKMSYEDIEHILHYRQLKDLLRSINAIASEEIILECKLSAEWLVLDTITNTTPHYLIQLATPNFSKLKEMRIFIEKHIDSTRSKNRDSNSATRQIPKNNTLRVKSEIIEKLSIVRDWKDVQLELNGDSNSVEIFIKRESVGTYHFDALGFSKRLTNQCKATRCWEWLAILAYKRGEIRSSEIQTRNEEMTYNSRKKELTAILRVLFPNAVGKPLITRHENGVTICKTAFTILNKYDRRTEKRDKYIDNKERINNMQHKTFLRNV